MHSLFESIARADRWAVPLTRCGLIVVLLWIGGLKAARYEADGIVPFVANSPFMSFFYAHPAPEYRQFMNKEGDPAPANHAWHQSNNTYPFAYGLGTVIVAFGVMLALHRPLPQVAAAGGVLVFLMSFVTLSFLITTPETWVRSFPYLSGSGRLVVKDVIMMGAALVCAADSAQRYLARPTAAQTPHTPR